MATPINPTYSRGEVVVVSFPFSDLSNQKLRPALVLMDVDGRDLVLCQITSQAAHDKIAIPLCNRDFAQGSLRLDSNIRPNKLFTFERSLIRYRCGRVNKGKIQQVVESIIAMLTSQSAATSS
jgi:mRNA interferase MazF